MPNFLKWILVTVLFSSFLNAKDFGNYGTTAAISEEDLIHVIQERVKKLSQDEQLTFMQTVRTYFTDQLKAPMQVKGIEKAQLYTVSYFDPSICVDRDILDQEKKVIIKQGTSFNPLSQVSLSQVLIFFDATDLEQLNWAKMQGSDATWILTKGQPLLLEEKLNRPIYFDQSGVLTKKFGIRCVPARISQEGLKLKIEETPVKETLCVI
jgi:conjugal transfer pilus assembly protein TraW